MRYVGGKSAIARDIVRVIERYRHSRSVWIEPFVGGGAVLSVAAKRYPTCYAYDLHPDLIMLYQALQQGWQPPTAVSEDEYKALRHAEPSALRGFVGFGCSFGAKWFGGYARGKNDHGQFRIHHDESRRNLLRMKLDNVHFEQASFFDLDWNQFNPSDCVIYCDPPYSNTQGYSVGGFDHAAFWAECERLHSLGFLVFVSEYNAPEHWHHVWQKDVPLQLKGGATANARQERLFMPDKLSTPFYMF
jgi:DNA adenine methylase